jgi:hypothetical protein
MGKFHRLFVMSSHVTTRAAPCSMSELHSFVTCGDGADHQDVIVFMGLVSAQPCDIHKYFAFIYFHNAHSLSINDKL